MAVDCQGNDNLKDAPSVAVVICAHTMERYGDIVAAVDSVLGQTITPSEVVVAVDHNEGLFEKLKDELTSNVKVVLNAGPRGLSETRNVGIRTSTAEIIAFMDDDAVAEKDCLQKLLVSFKDSNVMAVGGRAVSVWSKGTAPFWFPEEFDWTIGCTAHNKLMVQPNGEVRNVTGSNMAFRREVFLRIGYWETELGAINGKSRGGEEANICLRIKGGIDQSLILYEPEAVVFHKIIPGRDTLSHLLSYCWDEGFNRAKMRKATIGFVENPLSAEIEFLRRLLTISIFRRVLRVYRISNLAQVGAIMASLVCMGTTYCLGRVKYR